MRTLKYWFEKPTFIWLLIGAVLATVFFARLAHVPMNDHEQMTFDILQKFSESTFPPKIDLIRQLPDWQGHVGYYAVMGRVFGYFNGDIVKLRLVGLALVLAALFVFVRIGYQYTHINRSNPFWVSWAVILVAANPYLWDSAFRIGYMGPFLFFLLLSTYFHGRDRINLLALSLSLATLIDWIALLLAVAFVLVRILENQSRVLRPERLIALALPFVVGALPFMAWHGLVPQGEAQELWRQYWQSRPLFRLDALFYAAALVPIYGVYFTWAWGLRARTREQIIGAVLAGVLTPVFFLFPAKDELSRNLGLIDQAMQAVGGQYKNLLLFFPWVIGTFLFVQTFLMRARDQSRSLRFFIVLFFLAQPFIVGSGDLEFLAVVPFLFLLSLSESLVGEEGKLI